MESIDPDEVIDPPVPGLGFRRAHTMGKTPTPADTRMAQYERWNRGKSSPSAMLGILDLLREDDSAGPWTHTITPSEWAGRWPWWSWRRWLRRPRPSPWAYTVVRDRHGRWRRS